MRLTDAQIRDAMPSAKVRYLSDGAGLRLRIQPSGAKAWIVRYSDNGKERNKGLGSWPVVTLAMARSKAQAYQREAMALRPTAQASAATDVLADTLQALLTEVRELRQTQGAMLAQLQTQGAMLAQLGAGSAATAPQASAVQASGTTFAEIAQRAYDRDSAAWKSGSSTARITRAVMADHVLPALGDADVASVTPKHIADCLAPVWTAKVGVANRALSRIRATFKMALALGLRPDDPSASVTALLPARQASVTHRKAVAYSKLAEALAKVQASTSGDTLKALVRFTALTATRSAEARLADWSEIDLEARIWTLPADRMKKNTAHQVPLSDQAVALLIAQGVQASGPVFANGNGKPLSDRAALMLFKRLKIGSTVHGVRTSFRTWCGDTGKPRELAEHALAHHFGSEVERAYQRGTLLERRRELMQQWADYLDGK